MSDEEKKLETTSLEDNNTEEIIDDSNITKDEIIEESNTNEDETTDITYDEAKNVSIDEDKDLVIENPIEDDKTDSLEDNINSEENSVETLDNDITTEEASLVSDEEVSLEENEENEISLEENNQEENDYDEYEPENEYEDDGEYEEHDESTNSYDYDDEEENHNETNTDLLIRIHDLSNQIDVLKARLDSFEKRFNESDDAIINSANEVYKRADSDAKKKEGSRLGGAGLSLSIIFLIIGLIIGTVFAGIAVYCKAAIDNGMDPNDLSIIVTVGKICGYLSYGVLGFLGLGLLFSILGIIFSKKKGKAIAGLIISAVGITYLIIILFMPNLYLSLASLFKSSSN